MDILSLISICLNIFALIVSVLIAVAIYRIKPYHGNLTFLLLNISFNHCATLSLEIGSKILISEFEWNGIYNFWEISDFFTWAAVFNLICLLFERIAASFWDKNYENMFSGLPWLGMILLIFVWILSAIFVLLAHFKYADPVVLAVVALLFDIIVLIIFSFMPSITYKRYMHGQNTKNNFSLSQRYQMSENFRSSCLLIRIVWSLAITTIIASFLYILKSKGLSIEFLLELCYILTFGAQPIIYSGLIFYYETKIREFLLGRKMTERKISTKSIIGKPLVISNATEQCETYFQAYKDAWA